MKVGDLVRCTFTGELFVITSPENSGGYHDVWLIARGKEYLMPKEHLEVVNESR